jgi:apolipoprotein N-acyltransferase
MSASVLMELREYLKKVAWFIPGFLLWASFPPMAECTDILFALAPLMVLSRGGKARDSAIAWFKSGIFFWVATLSWMPAIVKNNGPWPLVVIGWSVLALYCAAYFAAYGYLSAKYWNWAKGKDRRFLFARRLLGCLIVEPVLWCGLELVRSRLFGGFAWNQLGVVAANSSFASPAALGGVYLLSAVIILINGSIAGIAERFIAAVKAKMRKPYDECAMGKYLSFETMSAFLLVFAIYHSAEIAKPVRAHDALSVAMVQRNFPCCFKGGDKNPYEIYSHLFSRVSYFSPDIVVLPESAMAEFDDVDRRRAVLFASYARRLSSASTILAGGARIDAKGNIYNSAALYDEKGVQVYDKVHLVPFGEFIPGDKLIPVLQKLAPVGSCTPGDPKLLYLRRDGKEDLPLGVAICFEDTDSSLIRSFAAKGARFLAFITNDSWFSYSNEAVAHSWQAVARAVETGLPVVRTGNSGVSGIIYPSGKANWLVGDDALPLVDASGVMCSRILLPRVLSDDGEGKLQTTVYVRVGDIPLGIIFSLLILTMIMVKYRHECKRI